MNSIPAGKNPADQDKNRVTTKKTRDMKSVSKNERDDRLTETRHMHTQIITFITIASLLMSNTRSIQFDSVFVQCWANNLLHPRRLTCMSCDENQDQQFNRSHTVENHHFSTNGFSDFSAGRFEICDSKFAATKSKIEIVHWSFEYARRSWIFFLTLTIITNYIFFFNGLLS